MKDCCFIGDRGYFSTELESRLIEQHSQFIIKGRSNMVSGTIVEAYGDGGAALPEHIGMKYRDIKSRTDQCLDVVLKTSTGHLVRVVRKVNPHPDSNRDLQATDMDKADERYVYLRTSIGRELLNAEQLSQLYRLRWMV